MRYEYKFLVNEADLYSLRRKLEPFVYLDQYSDKSDHKEYTVRSIYFDTSNLKYYHDKIEGLRKRKKVRIRGYNELESGSISFLEVKRKYGNLSKKNRSPIQYKDLEDLIKNRDIESYVIDPSGNPALLADAENFLHHIYKRSLKPIVLIVYDREAFYSKFDSTLRLTFDKNLRYRMSPSLDSLYFNEGLKQSLINKFIFEVKFNTGFPSWLQSIIRELRLSRQALSKYAICLDNRNILGLSINTRKFQFEDPFNSNYHKNNLDL